jgi:TfoX/Sxy family transcriptional regulator of competence genes
VEASVMGEKKRTKRNSQEAPVRGGSHALDEIVAALGELVGVEAPSVSRGKFGTNGLKVNGKIFAMLVGGALVVKLPRERVDALVASGRAQRFDPGRGKLMKEWATLIGSEDQWLELAREAHRFVEGGRK